MYNIRSICSAVLLSFLIVACNSEDKPKIVYDEEENPETNEPKKDLSGIPFADNPIHIDSTQVLLHPIGTYELYKSSSKIYSSSSYGNSKFKITNFSTNGFYGSMTSLKFQKIGTDKLYKLTDEVMRIQSVTFLREIFNNTKKQYFIYEVIDKDTNKDQLLNNNDIKSLYISKADGQNFVKLTQDFHQIIDWESLAINNRLYFRTVKDSNKNGEFDEQDQIYNHYVDFNQNTIAANSYFPLSDE